MADLRFFAAHYFVLGLLALLSYVYGRQLTWRIQYGSMLEQICFCVALGLGAIAYLIFFLGLLKLLTPAAVGLTLLSFLLPCYPVFQSWARWFKSARGRVDWRNRKPWLIAAISLVVILILIPAALLPLFPPTSFDATSYHLASAKLYVQNQQVFYTSFLRYAVLPQTNQMLFTLALLVYDDILAHQIEFLMMLVMAAGLIAFGARFFSKRAGWFAAALLLGSPFVLWSASVAYVDMGLMLFSTMTTLAFWNWLKSREQGWLILSGVFCAFALTTKYQGMFFLAAFGLVTLFLGIRQRQFRWPIVFGVTTLLVAAPWLLHNFYYTRNPFFPLFFEAVGGLIGYGLWSPEDQYGLMDYGPYYGVGKSFLSLIKLPWLLAFQQAVFKGEAPFSPIYFVLLPLSAAVSFKDKTVRGILILAAGYLLFWFYSIQALRFLVPVLPLLSIVTGASLDRILNWKPLKQPAVFAALSLAVIALSIAPAAGYVAKRLHERGYPPATPGEREAYLVRYLPSYPIYKYLNHRDGSNYRVYAMHNENMTYFADGEQIGDWFGPARYSKIQPHLTNGEALYNHLKSFGVKYFLVNAGWAWREPLPTDSFFESNFNLIFSRANVHLYELGENAGGGTDSTVGQLLANPGFENISNGWPVSWAPMGSPIMDQSGKNSYAGKAAVQASGNNMFLQVVPVRPNGEYILGFRARSGATTDQYARLQINWSDTNGQQLQPVIEVVKAPKEWTRFAMNATAPAFATRAVVYAASHDKNSTVWFDDFSFRDISLTSK